MVLGWTPVRHLWASFTWRRTLRCVVAPPTERRVVGDSPGLMDTASLGPGLSLFDRGRATGRCIMGHNKGLRDVIDCRTALSLPSRTISGAALPPKDCRPGFPSHKRPLRVALCMLLAALAQCHHRGGLHSQGRLQLVPAHHRGGFLPSPPAPAFLEPQNHPLSACTWAVIE